MRIDLKSEENSSAFKKARKRDLANKGKINCDRCPYHAGENRGRVPRPDKHKNHR